MKTIEMTRLYMTIVQVLALKGLRMELAYALGRNQLRLEPKIKAYELAQKLVQQEMRDLAVEHCAKDKAGKPIIVAAEDPSMVRYTGLAYGLNPEYDKRLRELQDKLEAVGDEEVDGYDIYYVKADELKRLIGNTDCTGAMFTKLLPLLRDIDSLEEK